MTDPSPAVAAPEPGWAGKLVDALLRQPPGVILGALVGAFGIVNILDSLVAAYAGTAWELIPDSFRPLFDLFRVAARSLVDFLTGLVDVRLPAVWQDYVAMGLIVAGMRLRSTQVIARALRTGDLKEYREDVFGRALVVRRETRPATWIGFFAWRLLFAFILWPMKLFGAASRFATGNLRKRSRGPEKKKVTEEQYLTFFGSVAWAVFLILLFLVIKSGEVARDRLDGVDAVDGPEVSVRVSALDPLQLRPPSGTATGLARRVAVRRQ